MPTDFMIDLETADTTGKGAIVDIGCVAINMALGTGFEQIGWFRARVALEEYDGPYRGKFDIGLRCLMDFWAHQPERIRINVFGDGLEDRQRPWKEGDDPFRFVSLVDALDGLSGFIGNYTNKIRVWAKPPQFDLVTLQHAYQVVGAEVPWHFRDERCFRTLLAEQAHLVSPGDITDDPQLMKHNALDDAIYQAKQLIAIRHAQARS